MPKHNLNVIQIDQKGNTCCLCGYPLSIFRSDQKLYCKQCLEHPFPSDKLNKIGGILVSNLRTYIIVVLSMNVHDVMTYGKIFHYLRIKDKAYHSMISFHLKEMINNGLIIKNDNKGYSLTDEGKEIYGIIKYLWRNEDCQD